MDAIAKAILAYAKAHNGDFPNRVEALLDAGLIKDDVFWLKHTISGSPQGARVIVVPPGIIGLPDRNGFQIVAFSSTPHEFFGRLVVDTNGMVSVMGEMVFQRLLAGQDPSGKPFTERKKDQK
jgi:hypothetical protein